MWLGLGLIDPFGAFYPRARGEVSSWLRSSCSKRGGLILTLTGVVGFKGISSSICTCKTGFYEYESSIIGEYESSIIGFNSTIFPINFLDFDSLTSVNGTIFDDFFKGVIDSGSCFVLLSVAV